METFTRICSTAFAAGAAIAFSSCTYDPYYSSSGVSTSYGYGSGYGDGNSGFSTSVFVSTGDPRWGYDPTCYSYYDYSSRRYYDPYLYGYYPVGYRPPVVIGVAHPYGWRPGRSYCPPPRSVRNVTVVNYRNRESAYRNSHHSWAGQVHSRPSTRQEAPSRYSDREPSRDGRVSPYIRPSSYNDATPYSRPPSRVEQPERTYSSPNQSPGRDVQRQRGTTDARPERAPRLPSTYNTPVAEAPVQSPSRTRDPEFRPQRSQPPRPESPSRSEPQPPAPRENRSRGDGERFSPEATPRRSIRGLGQG